MYDEFIVIAINKKEQDLHGWEERDISPSAKVGTKAKE